MKKIKVTENGIRKMILEEITDMNAIQFIGVAIL